MTDQTKSQKEQISEEMYNPKYFVDKNGNERKNELVQCSHCRHAWSMKTSVSITSCTSRKKVRVSQEWNLEVMDRK